MIFLSILHRKIRMDQVEFREKAKEILESYISNEKNISIIEKNLYNSFGEEEVDESMYFDRLYEVCHLLSTSTLKEVNEKLKNGKIGWNSEQFEEERKKQEEKDEFLTNPFNVEEGVSKCEKCGSNKTYSVSKQVRSADEGFSTFCLCLKCGAKWRNN